MTHRIISVKPLGDRVLAVVFQNGIEKEFNMRKLYSGFPQYRDFESIHALFEQVKVDVGGYGVSWNDELDLDAETIWQEGVEKSGIQDVGVMHRLAESLITAREQAGMTQKQLADIVGIYQADISKIERGMSNPSVATLQRLAEGLNMKIQIQFVRK